MSLVAVLIFVFSLGILVPGTHSQQSPSGYTLGQSDETNDNEYGAVGTLVSQDSAASFAEESDAGPSSSSGMTGSQLLTSFRLRQQRNSINRYHRRNNNNNNNNNNNRRRPHRRIDNTARPLVQNEVEDRDVMNQGLARPTYQSFPGLEGVDNPEVGSVLTNQASLTPTQASTTTSVLARRLQHQYELRRDRERRVQRLRQSILRHTGPQSRPSPISTTEGGSRSSRIQQALLQFTALYPNWLHRRRTETRCYKAVCSLPDSTNNALWSNESDRVLRLFFRVPRLNRRGNSQQKQLDRARLKLFVNPTRECPCPESNEPEPRPDSIIITVHQFIRPYSYRKRNNRVVYRRVLLDSIVVPGDGNLWTWLDVKSAVNQWMIKSNKNFGLELTVTDTNGTVLDAKEILAVPRCEEGTERSCREDDSERIQRVMWPSYTIGEDLNPYIDVRTGTKIQQQTFNQSRPFELLHLRPRRSASLSRARDRSLAESRLKQQFRQALIGNAQGHRVTKTNSQEAPHTKIADPYFKGFLTKFHSNSKSKSKSSSHKNHNKDCSCTQKHTSQQNSPADLVKSRSSSHRSAAHLSGSSSRRASRPLRSSRTKVYPDYLPASCTGKIITVNIKDVQVVAPDLYTTLQCPNTCRICSRGKCRRHQCKPVRQRLRVVVREKDSQKLSLKTLPGVKVITSCGC